MRPAKPAEDWDNRFWKEKIPRYNAILDKHCKRHSGKSYRHTYFRPRTISADSHKPPLAPSKSSALHETALSQIFREVEEMWKRLRIPDDIRRMYRSAFAKMRGQDVAHFLSAEVPQLREGTALIQRALAAVQQREDARTRLKRTVSRLTIVQVEGLQHKFSDSILHLRTASLTCAECLFALSDQLKTVDRDSGFRGAAITLMWQGRDYLKKMCGDLAFLQRAKVGRLMNVGQSVDPMLLSPALKPPDNKEFVTYRGPDMPEPMFIEGLLVVPIFAKDIDRLLHIANRLTSSLSPAPSLPPAHSSSQSSRGGSGGTVDSSKPILPLRLKVLVQRFQSAPTEDSVCVKTRAVSEMADFSEEERDELSRDIASLLLQDAADSTIELVIHEELVSASVVSSLIECEISLQIPAIAAEEVQQKTSATSTSIALPPLCTAVPLNPSFREVNYYEDELSALLSIYYEHLPASLLNISEKPAALLSLMHSVSQPCWRWIMHQDQVCGLAAYYSTVEETVVAHLTTLKEDWYPAVIAPLVQHLSSESLVLPLHSWSGDITDLEKSTSQLRDCGFRATERTGDRWSVYKSVYCRSLAPAQQSRGDVEVRVHKEMPSDAAGVFAVSPYLSAFEPYNQGGGEFLQLLLRLPAYELRQFRGLQHVRLKATPTCSLTYALHSNGLHSLCFPDESRDFLLLFIYGEAVANGESAMSLLQTFDYSSGSLQREWWVPLFQAIEDRDGKRCQVALAPSASEKPLLRLRPEHPPCVQFPFLFAVLQTTVWRVSRTPVLSAVVSVPQTGSDITL